MYSPSYLCKLLRTEISKKLGKKRNITKIWVGTNLYVSNVKLLSEVYSYLGDGVHGHQPGDEALVPGDVGEHGRVAVADGHSPGHAGVEVVVHADGQTWWFGRGSGQGDGLRGVAIPGVADAIGVADGLDPTFSQLW